MSFHKIKEGNLLQYVGRISSYQSRSAMIVSIDELKDGEQSFVVKVKNWKGEASEIRAYTQEVRPITLEHTHLEKLGFINDGRNVFTLEGIVLVRPIFYKGEWPNMSYEDKGFVVVEKRLALPLKEEEVASSTTPVTSLHTLQNYLEGKIVKVVDWETFL